MGEHDGTETGVDDDASSGGESRRTFLRTVGAASALGGAGVVGAQETTTEQETTTSGEETTSVTGDVTTILLGARTDYWLGLAPQEIEGVQNPTLPLRADGQYQLLWVNLDGERHRLLINDDSGETLETGDFSEAVGAKRALPFVANESMAQYQCEFHPEQMRGSLELGDGFGSETTAEETTEGGETTTGEGETTRDGETTTGAEGGQTVDVAVGPEGSYLRFVPEEVQISVGDTVRWTFESEGHNVTAKSEASSKVQLPEGAEPFATYEGNRSFMIVEVGETFEHTFTVPGTYVYVCAPHEDQGMVGRVVVSE
ncbi:plastocyanin/azurin family copper-binding protein [Halorussus halophilus]|uniref:plastocyanin/azurin family copper-binding protein n=1 Tax=Halorussus halophilus TaxID=2650975 RepID=UPI001CE450EC|nr:plastocyanin/azurin family copper-binding protein [Halorussus halophilus]